MNLFEVLIKSPELKKYITCKINLIYKNKN